MEIRGSERLLIAWCLLFAPGSAGAHHPVTVAEFRVFVNRVRDAVRALRRVRGLGRRNRQMDPRRWRELAAPKGAESVRR